MIGAACTWAANVPLAMAVVRMARPTAVVELGMSEGDSYSAICQAVRAPGGEARCWAIDDWAGPAGEQALAQFRAVHDPLYAAFSHVVRGRFKDNAGRFPDRALDLLHLDGDRGYDAAGRTWAAWLDKLGPRGVLLLTRINVDPGGAGATNYGARLPQGYHRSPSTSDRGWACRGCATT